MKKERLATLPHCHIKEIRLNRAGLSSETGALLDLPVGDVALLGGEDDADLCDRATVHGVLVGIALAVYLVEGMRKDTKYFRFSK